MSLGDDAVGQADALGLARVDGTAGEDQIEGARQADQPRQPHRAAVHERHAPAPAEHPEHGVLLEHAQVAPQRELESAGDRVAGHRRDRRLGQQHA